MAADTSDTNELGAPPNALCTKPPDAPTPCSAQQRSPHDRATRLARPGQRCCRCRRHLGGGELRYRATLFQDVDPTVSPALGQQRPGVGLIRRSWLQQSVRAAPPTISRPTIKSPIGRSHLRCSSSSRISLAIRSRSSGGGGGAGAFNRRQLLRSPRTAS